MTALGFLGAASCAVALWVTSQSMWAVIVLGFIWSFATSFVRIYGEAAQKVGLFDLVTFVVASGSFDASPVRPYVAALVFTVGTAWAMRRRKAFVNDVRDHQHEWSPFRVRRLAFFVSTRQLLGLPAFASRPATSTMGTEDFLPTGEAGTPDAGVAETQRVPEGCVGPSRITSSARRANSRSNAASMG